MVRLDYTDYQKLLDSFEFGEDSYNPHAEEFREYVELVDEFNPAVHPPKPQKKKAYIVKYIIPILQEHCRDTQAILEVHEGKKGILISVAAKSAFIINEETAFKSIIAYSTVFAVRPGDDGIRMEFFFATS